LLVLRAVLGIWEGHELYVSRWPWTAGAAALFIASLFYLPKASFKRALQLGLAAGISPQTIAREYGRDVPEAETLAQLERELNPLTADGKPGLGPAGIFFGGLLPFLLGAWMSLYSASAYLNASRHGYGPTFMISLLMLFGLGLMIVGLSMWTDWSEKTRNR